MCFTIHRLSVTIGTVDGGTSMKKIVFISGVSKGIGLATARLLREAGYAVYGGARTPIQEEGIHYLPLDVTSPESCQQAIQHVLDLEGHLDILINNAGMGVSGPIENTSLEQAKKNFEVNFFGVHNLTRAALPFLRQSKGRIINISSLASEIPIPYQAFYCASKAALDQYALALQMEVKPFGIQVTNIMPGDTKTSFTEHREKEEQVNEVYTKRMNQSVSKMETDEQRGMSPDSVAHVVLKILNKGKQPLKKAVGIKNVFLLSLFRVLPKKLAILVLNKMYNA